MARFSGKVGYGIAEVDPDNDDVFRMKVTEVSYFGDVQKDTRSLDAGSYIHDDISVNNLISIVADAFANEHFHAIKYVWWAGTRWTVTDVEVQRPRLLLRLGGVYDGEGPSPEPAESDISGDDA